MALVLLNRFTGCLKQNQGLRLVKSAFYSNTNSRLNTVVRNCLARRGASSLQSTAPKVTREGSSRIVGYWLAGCAGMCFCTVVVGGVTRLTESGLSIVDWQLLGRPPPSCQEEWEVELDKYKESPEYKFKNMNITMEEFKFIWWMEYSHRMLGRTIGAVFYVPAAAMWMSGMLSPFMKKRVVGAGCLLAFQGLLGWYMVKSGLDHENFQGPCDVPRVSQYRLAAHLSSAVVLYSVLLWGALDVLKPAFKFDPAKVTAQMAKIRHGTHATKALIFTTLVSGAFVAGLDAGLVYNSFPKMGDNWIPQEILELSPTLKNFTENPVTVQFQHRQLGTLTLAVITALVYKARKLPLPPAARKASMALLFMGYMQVTLGISTLLLYVPVPVASMHQAGALLTLSSALWFSHEIKLMKILKKIPK